MQRRTMRMWVMMLAAAMLAATGCQDQKTEQQEQALRVPPPAYDTAAPEPMPSETSAEPAPEPEPTGNATSASAQPEPESMPQPPSQPDTYTIRKGDTLWSIAERVYGDGQRWVDIVRANPGIDPKKLRVDQTITLP